VKKKQRLWFGLWAKALGPKEGMNEKEADVIACVRTIVFISYLTTNLVYRGWRLAPLARLMGLKQGYVAIDDELVRPVPCLLPRRAFNSQRNPLKNQH
jgi:hypothetical protein